MRQFGEVLSTHEALANVKVVQHSACASCHHKCGLHEVKDLYVSARNDIGAQSGDSVVLEMCHTTVLSAAFWAYVFPLFFLIAGVIAGAKVWNSEILGVVLGLSSLTVSYLFIQQVLEPHLKKQRKYQLAIVDKADHLECIGGTNGVK